MGLFIQEADVRLFAIALLSSTIMVGAANADCTTSINTKVADGYLLGDLGLVGSNDWVIQGGGTYACGAWSVDGWASWGPAGGTAIEFDGSLFYDKDIGPVHFQGAVQYFAVNLDDSLGDARDDLVEVYADVSLPLRGSRLTVAPLVRVAELIGLDDLPSLTLVEPGARVSYRLTDNLSVNAEVRDAINVTDQSDVIRFDATLAWQANERTAIRLGWQDTDQTRSVLSLGMFHQF